MRLQYIAGWGVNSVMSETIYRRILSYRKFPEDLISGTGDLIEPDDGIVGIGSGGAYALAAARALLKYSDLGAKEIAQEAMQIAGKICIYTNEKVTIEEL